MERQLLFPAAAHAFSSGGKVAAAKKNRGKGQRNEQGTGTNHRRRRVGEWMDADAAYAHAQHGEIMEKQTISEIRGMKVQLDDVIGVDWVRELTYEARDRSRR